MILKLAKIRQNYIIILIFLILCLVHLSSHQKEQSKGINEVLDELIEQAEKSNKRAVEAKKSNNNSRIIYLRQEKDKNTSHPITKVDEDRSERQNVFEHFEKTSSTPLNTIPPSIEDVVVEIIGNERKAHENKLNQTPVFSKEEWIIDIEEKNDEANSQTEVNKHIDKDIFRAAPESVEIISEEIVATQKPTKVTEENFYYNNSEKEKDDIHYNNVHAVKSVQGKSDNDEDRPNMYLKIKKLIEQILIMQSMRDVDHSRHPKKKKHVGRAGREEVLTTANPLMNHYNQFIRNNPTIRRVDQIDPPNLQIPSPLVQEQNVVTGPGIPFHPVVPLVPNPMVPNDDSLRWRVSNGLQYLLARRNNPGRIRHVPLISDLVNKMMMRFIYRPLYNSYVYY